MDNHDSYYSINQNSKKIITIALEYVQLMPPKKKIRIIIGNEIELLGSLER